MKPIVENTVIKLPNLKRDYHFLHVSDSHISWANNDESEDEREFAESETVKWSPKDGVSPIESWEMLVNYVKEHGQNLDAVIMTGDCINHFSTSIYNYIKNKIEEFPCKFFYVPGNHELFTYSPTQPQMKTCHREYYDALMNGDADFWVQDYGEFILIGMNNASRDVTAEQIQKFKEQYAKNVPIILAMHIPLMTNYALKRGILDLYYLFDCNQDASPYAGEFSQLVRYDECNVAAILAGHHHSPHEEEFAPGKMQYVAGAMFTKYIRSVTITSSED